MRCVPARLRPCVQGGPSSGGGAGALTGGAASAPFPRTVLRVIYHKWQHQLQRWADYRSLFALMAFTAVFLGVLYAQRGATVGFQVHSTIAAVVMPASAVLQSTSDVYSWLQGLLQVRVEHAQPIKHPAPRQPAVCRPDRRRALVCALQAVWVDPLCGDGTCEAPFEFAAFSRFGCQADCGRLVDIQNLTSAQVRGEAAQWAALWWTVHVWVAYG
jgi:hypothetical protein